MVGRVVVINDDSVPSGGAAAIALASVEALARRGLTVALLSADAAPRPAVTQAGAEHHSLGGSHLLDGNRALAAVRGLYDSGPARRLAAWIAANDTPDTVYHLHNWHKMLSPSVFSALHPVADRLLVSAHDFFLACPNGGFFNYPAGRACELKPMSLACLTTACDKRHFGHKAWRSARQAVANHLSPFRRSRTTVLAVHDGMVPLLASGGISRAAIRVLRNPVTPWCSRPVDVSRNRSLLFVGRLEVDKGADVLARVARGLGASVDFIGGGPLEADLRGAYPEFRFHGRLDRSEIEAVAATARMVVVPTRCRETFGLVALEAAGSGIPVIISNQALIAGEMEAHGCGLVADPSDDASLAAAIARLASDDGLSAEMGARGPGACRALSPGPDQWAACLEAEYRRSLRRARQSDAAPTAPLARGVA